MPKTIGESRWYADFLGKLDWTLIGILSRQNKARGVKADKLRAAALAAQDELKWDQEISAIEFRTVVL